MYTLPRWIYSKLPGYPVMVGPVTLPQLQSLPPACTATADEVEEVASMLEGLQVTAVDLMPRTGLWAYHRMDGTHSPMPSTLEDVLSPTWNNVPLVCDNSPPLERPRSHSP